MNYPLQSYPPSVYQWNLSYQLRLASNWLFSANYLGNKSTHIWTGEDVNPGVYIPGMCNGAPCSTTDNTNQRRVLDLLNPVTGAYYSDITQGDDGANGEYNALLLSAQHRFGNHYTILGNYTYSHCIDEGDFTGDLGIYGNVQNPFNRNADRGNCGFDIRHVANISFVAEMPRLSNPWTNRLLGNWQLSPIVSVRSGTWFTPFMGVDNSLTGIGDDRPDVIGNPYTRDMQTQQWLNANSFTPNAIGKFGNAGSQSLVGPNYVDLDVGVSRYFNVKEHQRFELRFEFFNTLNHVNFNTPDNYATDSTYGVMLSDYAPRILQFALKYTF
jgi:hypothetical protein